jgi:hypothetical protein
MSTPTPTPDPRDHETRPPEDPLAKLSVRQARERFVLGRPMRQNSPALVLQRTQRMHETHCRHARRAGVAVDYTVEELRQLVQRKLSASGCPYCRKELTASTFALTYKNPPRRGGRHGLVNLIVCCTRCRAIKGMLDGQEFQELLVMMRNWPEAVRHWFVARLLRGRGRYGPRPPDSPRAA